MFNSRKNINVIVEYIKCMIDKRPLRDITEICKILLPIAHKWQHNILDSLSKKMGNINLDGIIQSDETYTKLSFKCNLSKSKDFMPLSPTGIAALT